MKYVRNKVKYMVSEMLENFELTLEDEVHLMWLVELENDVVYLHYIRPENSNKSISILCHQKEDRYTLGKFFHEIVTECYQDNLIDFKPEMSFNFTPTGELILYL